MVISRWYLLINNTKIRFKWVNPCRDYHPTANNTKDRSANQSKINHQRAILNLITNLFKFKVTHTNNPMDSLSFRTIKVRLWTIIYRSKTIRNLIHNSNRHQPIFLEKNKSFPNLLNNTHLTLNWSLMHFVKGKLGYSNIFRSILKTEYRKHRKNLVEVWIFLVWFKFHQTLATRSLPS